VLDNKALTWIIEYFEFNNIPYLICGGLAAIAYGSQRPLNDIDIYVPDSKYQEVVNYGKEFISFGPERFKNKYWNVDYVQFNYMGQKIEIGSSENVEIFDAFKHEWYRKELDFDMYTRVVVFGKELRVMKKNYLIDYKRKLDREVDKIDIEQILKR